MLKKFTKAFWCPLFLEKGDKTASLAAGGQIFKGTVD